MEPGGKLSSGKLLCPLLFFHIASAEALCRTNLGLDSGVLLRWQAPQPKALACSEPIMANFVLVQFWRCYLKYYDEYYTLGLVCQFCFQCAYHKRVYFSGESFSWL